MKPKTKKTARRASGSLDRMVRRWKREAIELRREVAAVNLKAISYKSMLDWLLENLHLLEVHIDAGYCDVQKKPSANFRYLEYWRGGRRWTATGGQRERLEAAIRREMNTPNEKLTDSRL